MIDYKDKNLSFTWTNWFYLRKLDQWAFVEDLKKSGFGVIYVIMTYSGHALVSVDWQDDRTWRQALRQCRRLLQKNLTWR